MGTSFIQAFTSVTVPVLIMIMDRPYICMGLVALGLAVVGVASLLWLSTLVAAILGGIAVLTGFASLMVGKSGTLPAIVAAVAGFLTVLSAIISMKMQ